MESIFGVSMNSIMVVMLVLLFLSLAAVIWVAILRPVIFRMGMRNIPRRKSQSLLIVIGLMLATLISAAALTVGDTLNHSVGSSVYTTFGEIDQLVVAGNEESDEANIQAVFSETVPASSVDEVRAQTSDLEVDAVGGLLLTFGPGINIGDTAPATTNNPQELFAKGEASEPSIGIVSATQQTFDDFKEKDVNGNSINVEQLGSDKVYITEKLADSIDIGVGGYLVYVLNNNFYVAEVIGITPNTALAGSLSAPNQPGIIVGLDHLREATGIPEDWSAIIVSNSGNARAGAAHSDQVTDELNNRLSESGLVVSKIKADFLGEAELVGSLFVTMFIGFGLFSIAVGVLLIILIFTMLAAERRGEMGMARAIGGQRSLLVQQFLSEGAGYTLLSGLVGTTLGVGAAWIIAQFVGRMTGGLFEIDLYVHPRSLVVAYALGVIITFMAVIFSSWRASRLNIVAALRDIPEVSHPRQSKRPLILAALGALFGAYMVYLGETRPSISFFLIGITIIPFAIAVVTNWFGISSRWVLTAVGFFVLIVWAMPTDIFNRIFGDMGQGGIELFLLSGLSMVAASTLIIMQHMDLLLRAVQGLGSRVKGWLGAVRLGVAYPKSNGGRSGMTIAMFSLIVFSIVVMASVNSIFTQAFMGGNAMAGLDVQVQMINSNPIEDISAELEERGVDMTGVSAPGRMDTLGPILDEVQVTNDGEKEWVSASPIQAVDEQWIDLTNLTFERRATGYDSDEAVREAMKTQPNLVVVNSTMVKSESSASGPGMQLPDAIELTSVDDTTFEPYTITTRGEAGQSIELTVIGVMDAEYSMLFGYFLSAPTMAEIAPDLSPMLTTYSFVLDDGRSADAVAKDMEKALLQFGAQGVDVAAMMEEFQAQQSGFMTVLQWFMGLGLIVGIAAVGVISYRAVVERRQQIGVLRALGFQAKTIGRAFVIETGIIVVLGSLAGVILGLIVSYNLTSDEGMTGGVEGISFEVPWMTVLVTLGMAVGMALIMSWLPARQASKTLPAEALRYE